MAQMSTIDSFHFHILDYCVFGAMLILSAVTGIYFGYFRRKKTFADIQTAPIEDGEKKKNDFGSNSLNEYLLGSRQMKTFPVAMSLVASYISGVTILGTPSEIYNFGTQYWIIVIPICFMGLAVSKVYLPVFCKLKLASSYEYLEMRFSSGIRSFASIMFVIDEILFLPIILYVPSLAFNQVSGANIYIISALVCIVCVLYTLIGGIKAVVVTDAWQVMVMFLSVVVVVIMGTIAIGGPEEVINRANEGGRIIFFNFSPSLYERHTFWSVIFGGFLYWTSFNSVNQTMVQRYMSLPSMRKAQESIAIFTVGVVMFVSVCCFAGLLIYAFYYDCDPLTAGLIKADDQLFPVYVMQTVGKLQGIPGLFIAGVFGAALSSLSVVLNSTSAVILEDIVKGCFKCNPSEKASSYIVKGSILVLGGLSLALILVVEQLGGILSVATSLSAIAAGTTFGIFTLGMLIPWSNTKGAIIGAIAGALMSGWVSFGSQAALASSQVVPHKLVTSIEGCPANLTYAAHDYIGIMDYPDESGVFPLYRLSFHWINPIGVFTVLIVGTIVSFLTGPTNLKKLDPDLISPVLHRFLPKECFPTEATETISTTQTLTYLLMEPGTASAAESSKADDQLFPLYVMQTVGKLQGIPGLFIAGVFGAALSTLSVVLNATSAVILEDIVKGCFKCNPSEKASAYIVKGSVLVLGVLAPALIIVVEQLGGIFSVASSLWSIASGTTFGIFTLGMLIPWSNTKGAIIGGIAGALMSGWMSLGSQAAVAANQVVPHKLATSIEGCPANLTYAAHDYIGIMDYPDESDVFPLYRLSFHWINPIGVFTVLIVGTIVSFLTGPTNLKKLNPDLISPVLHRFLPKECFPTEATETKNATLTVTYVLKDSIAVDGSTTAPTSKRT